MTYTIRMPYDEGLMYDCIKYPAGEKQVRLQAGQIDAVKAATEIRVVASIYDGEIMDLALLTNALRSLNYPVPYHLTLPYLPYSRAERRFVDGDCAGLGTFGQMINSLCYNSVTTWDVHSDKAKKLINNLYNNSPIFLIAQIVEKLGGPDLTILLPDEGAARYQLDGLKVHLILQCSKIRDSVTGKLSGFKVPPLDHFAAKKVLIVDDICDGGGTFIGIADKMKDYGLDLYLYVTHGIFSKGLNELNKRFKGIYTSNSFISPYLKMEEKEERMWERYNEFMNVMKIGE